MIRIDLEAARRVQIHHEAPIAGIQTIAFHVGRQKADGKPAFFKHSVRRGGITGIGGENQKRHENAAGEEAKPRL